MIGHEREQAAAIDAQDERTLGEDINVTEDENPDVFMDDSEDFESMIDQTFTEIVVNQIITGKVLKVTTDDVVVDIGSKSEGVIPLREFLEDGKDPNVFVGMDVEVMVINRGGHDGLPVLSRRKAKERIAKKTLRESYENGTPVFCVVKAIVRGGFEVNVDGLRGFIPFSQMGPGARNEEDQKALIGQRIEAKILEMRRKRDLILSQRKAIEEKRSRLRKETMAALKVGNWIKGVVKNLTDFGAFVDLGGVDGLLHVNDMSWGHVAHPREVVNVGDEFTVMVLSVDGDRISLGLKQRAPDPWLNVQEKYPPGSLVGGEVTSLTKYGAFVGLEEGVEGLIHISEMSWVKRIHHPSELLKEKEEVRVKVLSIDEERKRISLSLRQTTVDPWTLAKTNYPPGTVIEGDVTGMTDFGAFVRLPEGVDGMIHVSDMSWAEKVNHPKQILKKGDKIQAKVLEIDPSQQRISLGLKQLEPDPWDVAQKKYKVGMPVEVKVIRMTEFGAFVELEKGIEGLAHASTLTAQKGKKPEEVVKVGDVVTMKVIKFDRGNRKISLSLKDFLKEQEHQEVQRYMADESGGNATLGELLGEQMHRLMQQQEEASSEPEPEPAPEAVEEAVETPEPEPVHEAVAEPVEDTASVEVEAVSETVEEAIETPEPESAPGAAVEPVEETADVEAELAPEAVEEAVETPEPEPAPEAVAEPVEETASVEVEAAPEVVEETVEISEPEPAPEAVAEPVEETASVEVEPAPEAVEETVEISEPEPAPETATEAMEETASVEPEPAPEASAESAPESVLHEDEEENKPSDS